MELEEKFKDDFCTFSDKTDNKLPLISSGSYYLDEILGGGYPKGCIVECFGNESVGKSTTALNLIKCAQAQYPNEKTVFVDSEHDLVDDYAINGIGIDKSRFSKAQPETGERALEIVEDAIRRGNYSVVVLDSTAGLVPQNELKTGKVKPGEIAGLLSRKLNIIKDLVVKTQTILFCTSQMRIVSMVPVATYGPTGGNALKFYAKIRLRLKIKEQIVLDNENVGQVVRAFTEKNKAARPKRICDYYIKYGTGISEHDELLTLGIEKDIIQKSGTWFSSNGTNLGQGRGKAVDFLDANKDIADKIKHEVFKENN